MSKTLKERLKDSGITLVEPQEFLASAAAADGIKSIGQERKDVVFNKLWLWPARGVSSGKRTENNGSVYIGVKCNGNKTTPDELTESNAPMKIELPVGQVMRLEDVLFQVDEDSDGILCRFS